MKHFMAITMVLFAIFSWVIPYVFIITSGIPEFGFLYFGTAAVTWFAACYINKRY